MVAGQITLKSDTSVIGPFNVDFISSPNELEGWKYRGQRFKAKTDPNQFYFIGWKPSARMEFRLRNAEQVDWLRSSLVVDEEYRIIQFQFYTHDENF